MKKLCIMLVLLGAVLSITGCNTIKGAGKDVENVGDAMKDAAN